MVNGVDRYVLCVVIKEEAAVAVVLVLVLLLVVQRHRYLQVVQASARQAFGLRSIYSSLCKATLGNWLGLHSLVACVLLDVATAAVSLTATAPTSENHKYSLRTLVFSSIS